MYTSYIGKQFLKLYNQKTGSYLTAKRFFNDIMFPLFFDSKKDMMQVSNSPFFQHSKKRGPAYALSELHRKISDGEVACDTAVGFPAAGITGTTTGQITTMDLGLSGDDVYASWIGGGLGVGVAGGYILFVDDEAALWTLYEGWKRYREYLGQVPHLKPNQITTWNGQWLAWSADQDQQPFSLDNKTKSNNGIESIDTVRWSVLLFSLSGVAQNKNRLMAYTCNFGQMNESLGFIELFLKDADTLYQLRRQLTGISDPQKFALLYETKNSFKIACQYGTIGLQALEPKELDVEKPVNIKKLKAGDEKTVNQYYNNLIWRVAMLNNQQSLELARQFAKFLKDYSESGDKGKTTHKNNVEALLASRSKSKIINQLADIAKGFNTHDRIQLLDQVVEEINSMNIEKIRIFISLSKYAYYSI